MAVTSSGLRMAASDWPEANLDTISPRWEASRRFGLMLGLRETRRQRPEEIRQVAEHGAADGRRSTHPRRPRRTPSPPPPDPSHTAVPRVSSPTGRHPTQSLELPSVLPRG